MTELRYDTVTLLTDYGLADGWVGVMHSVIRQLSPGVGIVDLAHQIAPFDVRGGSLLLARSVQYLCPGVIVAVVDPGVGTQRRAIAVEVAGGAAVLVGPDNGLHQPSVISCDNITTIPKSALQDRIGTLLDHQEADLAAAIHWAYNLQP